MSTCIPADLMEQPRQFREHYYETDDAMEAVAASGYFAPAAHMLAAGDLVKVRASLADDIVYEEFLVTHVNVARLAVTLQPRSAPPAMAAPEAVRPRKAAVRKPAARKEG